MFKLIGTKVPINLNIYELFRSLNSCPHGSIVPFYLTSFVISLALGKSKSIPGQGVMDEHCYNWKTPASK
jgi:hypothetical protein